MDTVSYIVIFALAFIVGYVMYDFIKTIRPPDKGRWGGEGGGGSTGTRPDPSNPEEEQVQ